MHWVGVAAFAGSLFSLSSNTGYLVTEIIVFLLIQKALEKFERSDISLAPLSCIQFDLSGSALCRACCFELKLVYTHDGLR